MQRRIAVTMLVAVLAVAAGIGPAGAAEPPGTFAAGPTPPALAYEQALLLNDGTVLVLVSASNTAKLYDPVTETWSDTSTAPASPSGSQPVLLFDGDVLLFSDDPSDHLRYEPGTDSWTGVPASSQLRSGASHTLMADGRVLVAGGVVEPQTAEIYDPVTNTWLDASDMPSPKTYHDGVLLPSGDVLLAGGRTGLTGFPTGIAMRYTPGTDVWTLAGVSTPGRRMLHLLPNGKVLAMFNSTTQTEATTDLYDPIGDTWTAGPSMGKQHTLHGVTQLANGEILAVGSAVFPGIKDAELYDPASNTWRYTGEMTRNFQVAFAVTLADTRVYVLGVGNEEPSEQSQIYEDDSDGDGYNDGRETQLAENPAAYCDVMRADVDGNGTVNAADLGRIAEKFFYNPISPRFDQNENGAVNAQDLGLVAQKFSQTVGSCP